MTLSFQSQSDDGSNASGTISYSVLGKPVVNGTTFYKVQLEVNSEGQGFSVIALVDPSGKVASVEQNNQSLSGQFAQLAYMSAVSPFILELTANQQVGAYIDALHVTQVNQTTVTLGPTTLSVNYYAAKTVPYTITYCDKSTTTINSLSMAYGKMPGTDLNVITYFSVSQTYQGSTSTSIIKLTSISKA